MKRTISVMLGKGSINHNTRKFKAENIDAVRTGFNISYIDTPIKEVYHELFDKAAIFGKSSFDIPLLEAYVFGNDVIIEFNFIKMYELKISVEGNGTYKV